MKKVSGKTDQRGLVKSEMEDIVELDSEEQMMLRFAMKQARRLRAGESFTGEVAAGSETQGEDQHRQPKG